jgi:hypothetical protein
MHKHPSSYIKGVGQQTPSRIISIPCGALVVWIKPHLVAWAVLYAYVCVWADDSLEETPGRKHVAHF